ncbi:MAG: DUF814 domain-containing protein [Desulfovibrio sp.]|nr:DUF814 domain-containing protein [Desulfovibrio sp.]
MDAHLFRRLTDELPGLLKQARLEKIQSPVQEIFSFVFYTRLGKRQLCLRYGRQHAFLFLSSHPLSAGSAPPANVMRLRKYLQGRRVRNLLSQPFQRRLWLLFEADHVVGEETAEQTKIPCLLLDLREGVFLHFLEPEALPVEEDVEWPRAENLFEAIDAWRDWPVLTPTLRKTLVQLDPSEALALMHDLRLGGGDLFTYRHGDMAPQTLFAWPLPPALAKDSIEEVHADALGIIEQLGQRLVYAEIVRKEEREQEQKERQYKKKRAKLLQKLKEEEERLSKMCEAQQQAMLLKNAIWQLDKKAKMRELVLFDESQQRDVHLVLDERYTLQENMERLFHTAQRGKRGLIFLKERKDRLEHEDFPLETNATDQPKAPLSKQQNVGQAIQEFRSSDGFLMFRGKNARGNLACRRIAKNHDIWLHVLNGPGAHVVIRLQWPGQEVPERTLREAGQLAANKSWQQHADTAAVQYAEIRHIKAMKGAAAGTVKIDKVLLTREVPVDATVDERLSLTRQA